MSGNRGRRPDLPGIIPMRADQGEIEIPDPPYAMEDEAHAVWGRYSANLCKIGRLDLCYHEMFAQFCVYASIFRRASAQVAIEGFDMTNAEGLDDAAKKSLRNGVQFKASPAWRQMNQAADYMLKLSDLFGLTPRAARALSADGQGELFDDIVSALNQKSNVAA